jgi:hypothetical protein
MADIILPLKIVCCPVKRGVIAKGMVGAATGWGENDLKYDEHGVQTSHT